MRNVASHIGSFLISSPMEASSNDTLDGEKANQRMGEFNLVLGR